MYFFLHNTIVDRWNTQRIVSTTEVWITSYSHSTKPTDRSHVSNKVAKKNLFAPTYGRTVTNEKSLINCLRKAYNWLKNMDLIPFSLWKMSPRQLKQHISQVISLYIVDNKQLLELFFNWLYDNSDQRRIRTENQIRTKDKFGPNFEIRPKLFR